MDEVDGMDGNADRGGVSELISLIKTSHICQKTSIRSLANHCYDLPFQRQNVKQICAAVRSICFKEGIKIEPQALTEIVIASGQDVRQVLHTLSLWSVSDERDTPLSTDIAMEAAKNAKKHSKMNPFNVVRTVFAPFEGERELSLLEKSDLFFHDYSLSSLFVQENYARVHQPINARVAMTADSLCHGDLLEKTIRKDSHWELLPMQAFLSSVIPGEHIRGDLVRPAFPQWLGMHSRTSRCDRLLQDLQRHTRLATSCNKTEFGLEYLPHLAPKLTQPLVAKGIEGVADVVDCMTSYDLQRDDWEAITELAHYSGRPELTTGIFSQVKAAFTRTFNKSGHLSHYSSTGAAAKRSRPQAQEDAGGWQGEEGGEGELEEEGEESEASLDKDPAIKVVKKDKGKTSRKNSKGQKNGKKK